MYLAIARPLEDTDLDGGHPDAAIHGDNGAGDAAFDVSRAFSEMRWKHAWEAQSFVLGHQQACIDSLARELTLDCQHAKLRAQIAEAGLEQSPGRSPEMTQTLLLQAKAFVDTIHFKEMKIAEQKIKEKFTCPASFLLGLRLVVVLMFIFALTAISHELLMRVFAVFFALGCGMALLWEDMVVMGGRLILGQSLKRLENLRAQTSQVSVNLPIAFWQ